MGNYMSFGRRSESGTGKVVLGDGTVQEFDGTLTVAELMLEHPQQVVVEFHSAVAEKKPTPLPADKKLDMGKVYLMLPLKRGKPAALSSEEARCVLLSATTLLRSKSLFSSPKFLPLFAGICTTGPAEKMQRLSPPRENGRERNEEVESVVEFLPESLEGRPEYMSRQISCKGWKPSLDTIKEKNVKVKVSHWLF
ncbi:hypothetical protein SLE2022_331860 [Rubroshorea leprosula]